MVIAKPEARIFIPEPDTDMVALLKEEGIEALWVLNSQRRKQKYTPEQIAKRMDVWLKKYKVSIALDTQQIFLGEQDFVFKRGQSKEEMRQVQATLDQTRATMLQYQKIEAEHLVKMNDLKVRMSKKQEGPAIDALRQEVLAWQNVIDIQFGPGKDNITGVAIKPGEFVITFLPVAFDGTDLGFKGGQWAVSNPIRFHVKEEGTVFGIGVTEGGLTTYQPHMLGNRMCNGNLFDAYKVMVRENNVLGAIGVLDEWRISHGRGHYIDHQWHTKAWIWWDETMVQRLDRRKPDLWLFDGRWDGRTIQLSNPEGIRTLTNIEEFFGGTLEQIVHVGNGLGYISPALVKKYVEEQAQTTQECRGCGNAAYVCNCHGQTCAGCQQRPMACYCAAAIGFVKPVRDFVADGYTHLALLHGNGQPAYVCEREDRRYRQCGLPADWQRRGTYPAYVCDAHLTVHAQKARQAAQNRAVEASKGIVEKPTAAVKTAPMMRHKHEHNHTDKTTLNHTHHHEHPKEDVQSEQINEHQSTHAAYTYEKGTTRRRTSHGRIL